MTKQDKNILFMAILTLALIVAAGVRVLFGAVAAAGGRELGLGIGDWGLVTANNQPLTPNPIFVSGLGMAAGMPRDVLKAIRNWPAGLTFKERAIFSEGLLALILRPVRSLDMASLISPFSQAGAITARFLRTARAQVWGWIQSVKKSLAKIPSRKSSPSPSPFQGEGVRFFLPDVSSLYKFCVLRL